MKKEFNKWQYGIEIRKCPPWRFGFYPYIRLWFLKFVSFPPEGQTLNKENYRGLFWEWTFQRDLIVRTRTFKLPIKLRIFLLTLGIRTRDVYVIPIWLYFK